MKIRHGFVSNSSTTSFCIYGMVIRDFSFNDDDDDDSYYDDTEKAEEIAEKAGLDTHSTDPYDDGGLYVGLFPDSSRPTETFQEFYDRVKNLISKTFGIKNPQCNWIVDAWRDG